MHATIRHYEGIENPTELLRQLNETFMPAIKAIPGFVTYAFVDVGDAGGRMVSTSVFESEEGTDASNKLAAEWVAARPGLIPTAKLVEAGHVVAS